MRVTTQMLNESARKAGLPINNTSLLNYLDDNSNDTLISALTKSTTTDTVTKTKYEKLEKTADQLFDAASIFMSTDEDSLFSKARESGDNQDIYNAVDDFVGKYNSTLSALKNMSDTMNDYYAQMLKSAASGNKEALAGIGISVAKDGSLSVDKDKLKGTDIDALEKVLGSSTGFTQKVAYLAGKVSDNAQTNISSLSSQYSSSGSLYSALASKYDLFG
ncbi:MAG: hypothetical protein HDR03_15275 [Lachnospiraceae bacterium]|nr:hypothetical protein [Lachnospiraceae bacterium]